MEYSKETHVVQILLDRYEGEKLDTDGKLGTLTEKAINRCYDKYVNSNTVTTKASTVTKPQTAHFKLSEYTCRDGSPVPVKYYANVQKSMNRLEKLREALRGAPITINSGYRSPSHNAKVGGAKNSAHMRGTATDIVVKGVSPKDVYKVADRLYPEGGVALYDSFVHVDLDTEVKRPWRG